MKIVSEVLGLFGATSGTSSPDPQDAVLEFPPVTFPTYKLYRPPVWHAGFLAGGIINTSFFYSDRFTFTNTPAADSRMIVLGRGMWEIDLQVSSARGFAGVLGNDHFSIFVQEENVGVAANIWTNVGVGAGDRSSDVQSFYVISRPGTELAFFAHTPVSGVGQTVTIGFCVQGRRLT